MIRLIIREVNHFLAKFFDDAYSLGYDDGEGDAVTQMFDELKSNEMVRDTPEPSEKIEKIHWCNECGVFRGNKCYCEENDDDD